MAQESVAPRKQAQSVGGKLGAAALGRRIYELLPKSPSLGPVAYTPMLVAYVVGTAVAALVVAALLIAFRQHISVELPPQTQALTLVVGGVTIFLMSVFAVRLPGSNQVQWAPSVFIHLGLAVTFGPVGAVVGAIAEPLGVSVRNHNGWFRTTFNVSNAFLANVSAWAVFAVVNGPTVNGTGRELLGGLAAGVVHFVVNSGFVAVVIHLSDRRVPIAQVVRMRMSVLPYSIGYGFAAFAFVAMSGPPYYTVGFLALLAPLILLHGFLIRYTRNVHESEVERTAHQKEREGLLQKAVEASEAERRRIARDLHDGVVQNLAGMAFALSAEASQLKGQGSLENGHRELLDLLETSADETRGAMKDLRTLIIELAPPTLRREGLHAALLEVLREMKRSGTNTELDLPPNLRLREDRGALIFRVAQEILRNVASHAHAKNVKVELTEEDGSAILSIQDDGKGFSQSDVDRRRAEGHLGTTAIVELAEDAGGTLTIDSEPGRGTLVVLTLPIE
jgi:signal transduction histidine kinase